MATILAAASGNWNNTATWVGGVIPTVGDVVVANGRTVTVNQSIDVAELRQDTTGGAASGGTFTFTSGTSVKANLYGSASQSVATWSPTLTSQTLTYSGSVFGGNTSSGGGAFAVNGVGVLTILAGSILTGGNGFSSGALYLNLSAGSATINATVTGGTNAAGPGIWSVNCPSLTINGNITGGSAGRGLRHEPSVTSNVTVNGTVTGGSGSSVFGIDTQCVNAPTSTLSINGNIFGGSGSQASGVNLGRTGNVSITGNLYSNGNGAALVVTNNFITPSTVTVTGVVNGTSFGAGVLNTQSNASVNVIGSVNAGAGSATLTITGTGAVSVTRAVGNLFGFGGAGTYMPAIQTTTTNTRCSVQELEVGQFGSWPIYGAATFENVVTNKITVPLSTGSTKILGDVQQTMGALPDASDVRSGIVYYNGNRTGSCNVPPAGSVALGVPVDNTTGTAVLTSSGIRSALGLANPNLDAQFSKVNGNIISSALAL